MFRREKKWINDWVRARKICEMAHFSITNKDISIIASNCNGGVLCKDLRIPFLSPFVNLWIPPRDYIHLLQRLKEYMKEELHFIQDSSVSYPVALLGDVRLYFQHYQSRESAEACWIRRRERINYDNLLVLFTDRDGCSYEDLKAFDCQPYKKVVFTAKQYDDIESAVYVDYFKSDKEVGILTDYVPKKWGVRYYDMFNFASLIDCEKN